MATQRTELSEQPTPLTDCPMTAALTAVGGKWSLICLYFLDTGTRRFNELRRLVPELSHKVLTETLRNLEHEGLIVRTVHALAPSHVEYELSAHGESVRPLIRAVRGWGRRHLAWKRGGAVIDPAAQASSRSAREEIREVDENRDLGGPRGGR